MASDDRPRWGPAWLFGITILVLGVIVALGSLTDDDGTSSAADAGDGATAVEESPGTSAEPEMEPTDAGAGGADAPGGASPELEAECMFVERTSTLTLDGALATALARAGAEVKVIAPATGSLSRGIALPIVTSRKITCPDYGRVIGHRGGVELDLGTSRIELRRFRITTADGRTEVFAGSRTSDGVPAFTADLDAAIEPNLDNIITLRRVPLTVTPAGADALNDALGTEIFSPGMPFGLLDVR